ncbi:hypothetical protein ScPMuIL_009309 [Solemya velum]
MDDSAVGESCFQLRRIGQNSTNSRVPNIMRLKLGITSFGRGQNNDFVLDSEKLKNFISRQHAEIHGLRNEKGGMDFTLFDRGLNGTFINDIKVNKNCFLEIGDKITFGHTNGYKLSPGQYASQPSSEFQFKLEEIPKNYSCMSSEVYEASDSDGSNQDIHDRLHEPSDKATLLDHYSAEMNGQQYDNSSVKFENHAEEKTVQGNKASDSRTTESCEALKRERLCGEQIVQQDFLNQEKNMSQRNGCTYKQIENREISSSKKSPVGKSPKRRNKKLNMENEKPDELTPSSYQYQNSSGEKTTPRNSDLVETLPYETTPSSSQIHLESERTSFINDLTKDESEDEKSETSDSEQVTPQLDRKSTSLPRKIFPDETEPMKSKDFKNRKSKGNPARRDAVSPARRNGNPRPSVSPVSSHKKETEDPYLFSEEDSSSDAELVKGVAAALVYIDHSLSTAGGGAPLGSGGETENGPALSSRSSKRLSNVGMSSASKKKKLSTDAQETVVKTSGSVNKSPKRPAVEVNSTNVKKGRVTSRAEAVAENNMKGKKAKTKKQKDSLEDGVEWYEEELCDALDCKKPKAKRVQWVQCDDCDKWYHTACVHCNYDKVKDMDIGFSCGCG